MAKTTLVQQLSVQKSENLKAVELFLTTRALFHTLKSLVFRQNRQAQATVKFKRMSGKINSVNATFTILIHLTSRRPLFYRHVHSVSYTSNVVIWQPV